MKETKTKKIDSPCTKKCFLDECLTYCLGCGRTIEQIGLWWKMSPEEKEKALKDTRKRIMLPSSNG